MKTVLIIFDIAYRLEIYILPILWLLRTYYYKAEYVVLLAYFVFTLPYLIFMGIFGKNKVYYLLHRYNKWLYTTDA